MNITKLVGIPDKISKIPDLKLPKSPPKVPSPLEEEVIKLSEVLKVPCSFSEAKSCDSPRKSTTLMSPRNRSQSLKSKNEDEIEKRLYAVILELDNSNDFGSINKLCEILGKLDNDKLRKTILKSNVNTDTFIPVILRICEIKKRIKEISEYESKILKNENEALNDELKMTHFMKYSSTDEIIELCDKVNKIKALFSRSDLKIPDNKQLNMIKRVEKGLEKWMRPDEVAELLLNRDPSIDFFPWLGKDSMEILNKGITLSISKISEPTLEPKLFEKKLDNLISSIKCLFIQHPFVWNLTDNNKLFCDSVLDTLGKLNNRLTQLEETKKSTGNALEQIKKTFDELYKNQSIDPKRKSWDHKETRYFTLDEIKDIDGGSKMLLTDMTIQLRNFFSSLLTDIDPSEFAYQSWTKTNQNYETSPHPKELRSPHILDYCKQHLHVSDNVEEIILSNPDKKVMKARVEFFCELIRHLLKDHNYSAASAIANGLNQTSINRLRVWLDPKGIEILDECRELTKAAVYHKTLNELNEINRPILDLNQFFKEFVGEDSKRGIIDDLVHLEKIENIKSKITKFKKLTEPLKNIPSFCSDMKLIDLFKTPKDSQEDLDKKFMEKSKAVYTLPAQNKNLLQDIRKLFKK